MNALKKRIFKNSKKSANTERHERINFLKDYSNPMIPIFSRENFDKKKYDLIFKKRCKAASLFHYFLSKSNFYKYISEYVVFHKHGDTKYENLHLKSEKYRDLHFRAKALYNRYQSQCDAMKPWLIDFTI